MTWSSPQGIDSDRNAVASPLLKQAGEKYAQAIDLLAAAVLRVDL